MTVKQAAEKWEISDRRVRILYAEGKVSGVIRGVTESEKLEFGGIKWTDPLQHYLCLCRLMEKSALVHRTI